MPAGNASRNHIEKWESDALQVGHIVGNCNVSRAVNRSTNDSLKLQKLVVLFSSMKLHPKFRTTVVLNCGRATYTARPLNSAFAEKPDYAVLGPVGVVVVLQVALPRRFPVYHNPARQALRYHVCHLGVVLREVGLAFRRAFEGFTGLLDGAFAVVLARCFAVVGEEFHARLH